jgi:hypothetical protein
MLKEYRLDSLSAPAPGQGFDLDFIDFATRLPLLKTTNLQEALTALNVQ